MGFRVSPQQYQKFKTHSLEARRVWARLYHSGTRISWCDEGKHFRFWRCPWPDRLRVEFFGEYGRFECEEFQPSQDLLEVVWQYGIAWRHDFFPKRVPADLVRWFYHPLSADYEVPVLFNYGLDRGVVIKTIPFDGGLWPTIADFDVRSVQRAKEREMPPLLGEYLQEEKVRYGKGKQQSVPYSGENGHYRVPVSDQQSAALAASAA